MAIHYHTMGNDTIEYFYSSEGHITREQNMGIVLGSDIEKYQVPFPITREQYKVSNSTDEYEYKTGRIIKRHVDPLKKNISTQVYVTDNKGMAIDLVTQVSYSPMRYDTLRCEFNAKKQLIRSWLGGLIFDTLEYVNGNLILTTWPGPTPEKALFEYDTLHFNTIGNENLGKEFCGVDSKNPVIYSIWTVTDRPARIHSYSYHYDDKGRITIRALYEVKTGKQIDSTFYTYY